LKRLRIAVHDRDAIGEPAGHLPQHLVGQSGLAYPARPVTVTTR
jgi:hypothetical protein